MSTDTVKRWRQPGCCGEKLFRVTGVFEYEYAPLDEQVVLASALDQLAAQLAAREAECRVKAVALDALTSQLAQVTAEREDLHQTRDRLVAAAQFSGKRINELEGLLSDADEWLECDEPSAEGAALRRRLAAALANKGGAL